MIKYGRFQNSRTGLEEETWLTLNVAASAVDAVGSIKEI